MAKNFSASMLQGMLLGVFSALIFFIFEWLLSSIYAEISVRTYLFFFLLYLATGLIAGGFVGSFLKFISDRMQKFESIFQNPNLLPAAILSISFFLYGFYYLNEKITPGVGIFAPVSLAANLIYFLFTLLIFRIALGAPTKDRQPYFAYLTMAVLPLSLLLACNFRFFLWHAPVTFNQELFTATFGFGFVGLIGIGISRTLVSFASIKQVNVMSTLASTGLAIVFVGIIAWSGRPSTASYQIHEVKAPLQSQLKSPKNIIWIVMDTARRDHVSIYGDERKLTPNIDAFAKEALIFKRAVSSAPWTIPSHASMFTGMFPSKHAANRGVPGGKFTNPLSPENLTIAEILQSHGYDTACMAANVAGLSREFGFSQGFNYYFDGRPLAFHLLFGHALMRVPKSVRKNILRTNEICLTSEMNGIVFDWLERRSKAPPFFLFINLMEAHDGIEHIPEPYYSMLGYDKEKFDAVLKKIDQRKVVRFEQEITEKEIRMLETVVDRRVHYMDFHIGKLLEKLKSEGVYDDAFIIITSDHGELNGEHRSFGHNTDLYNELIWIPLIVKYPGNSNQGFSEQTVQNIDIMPELLHSLGIEIPEQVQGQPFAEVTHDIIAELFEQKKAQALLYPERYFRDLRAIFKNVDGDSLKYIWSSNGKDELYDMSSDVNESINLVEQKPEVVTHLDKYLSDWLNSFEPVKAGKGEMKYTKEIEERLRSLGYLK
ncbi:MAG: sulfatase-like hydrolase/transferase [bacterium]